MHGQDEQLTVAAVIETIAFDRGVCNPGLEQLNLSIAPTEGVDGI